MTGNQEEQLREILAKIGYPKVEEVAPYRARLLWEVLAKSGYNIYATYVDAKAGVERAEKLIEAARLLMDIENTLSPTEKLEVQRGSTLMPLGTAVSGQYPVIWEAKQPIGSLFAGLLELQHFASNEAQAQKTGAPRHVAVQQIADGLAEVYVIGLRKHITVGVRAETNDPSTLFTRTLHDVLKVLGVPTGSVRRAAKNVQEALTDHHVEQLYRIHDGAKETPTLRPLMFR